MVDSNVVHPVTIGVRMHTHPIVSFAGSIHGWLWFLLHMSSVHVVTNVVGWAVVGSLVVGLAVVGWAVVGWAVVGWAGGWLTGSRLGGGRFTGGRWFGSGRRCLESKIIQLLIICNY